MTTRPDVGDTESAGAAQREQLAFDTTPTAPERVDMSGTDLLVALRGTSGINPQLIDALLDHALEAVPAPPLHDISRAAIYQWLHDVQDGLASRREQRWLARRVAEALFDEWSTAEWIERTRRMVSNRTEIEQLKRDGSYWAQQEARRESRRPARFRVTDHTWHSLRREADTLGTSLGELLGQILQREAQRMHAGGHAVDVEDHPTLEPRFIRIAIDGTSWADLKNAARQARCTITNYNSQIITDTAGHDTHRPHVARDPSHPLHNSPKDDASCSPTSP